MRKLNPEFIKSIDTLRSLAGGDALDTLVGSLQTDEPAVAVRVNRSKGVTPPDHLRRVAWAVNGAYIDGERPRFTFDPALHQGLYYVQDPSSMVIETVVSALVKDNTPTLYLDACAAPGGKTTAAINSLPSGSMVIANEYERRRAEILVENIIKWGYPNVAVTCCDTSRLTRLGPIVDIVAADLPCSGEGMMRKEDAAIEQWSAGLVAQCASLQREIVDNLWPVIKPGGYLIYSTCTFNCSENEDNIRYIIEKYGAFPVDLHISELYPGIAEAIGADIPVARFIPGCVDGEGIFLAVLQKPSDAIAARSDNSFKVKTKNEKKSSARGMSLPDLSSWLNDTEFTISIDNDTIKAHPTRYHALIKELSHIANVVYAGVEIATTKGRDIIPSQSLAMSSLLNRASFPNIDVDYITALQYLSRQSITLAEGTPKGIVLLTYGGRPLGFAKNLGNRANNLYPAAWAIRSTHLPDSPVSILK